MNINKKIIEEAVKLLKDYPHLKYFEAIEKAKEIFKNQEEVKNG